MRLESLGKISKTSELFNNLISNGTRGNLNLANVLKDLDTQSKIAVVSQSALNETQKIGVLATSGLTSEELKHTVSVKALSTGQKEAAASTGVLSAAFTGLAESLGISTAALGAFIGVAAAFAVGYVLYKQVQKHNEELRQSALDSLDAYQDTAKSIDEYKTKIKELRAELDSGTLTESEAVAKKAELISIQNELNDTYGTQVEGLRLVSGALEDQLQILDQVTDTSLDDWYRKNYQAINNAKNTMTKDNVYTLADFFSVEADKNDDVTKLLKDAGFDFEKQMTEDGGGYTYKVKFTGDATEANDAVQGIIEQLETLNNTQYNNENMFISSLVSQLANGQSDIQNTIDKYQDIYMQALTKEAGDKYFGSGTVSDVLTQYSEAISKYNTALQDEKGIERAKTNYESMVDLAQKVTDQYGEFVPLFDEVGKSLNKSAINSYKFTQSLKNDSVLRTHAKNLKDLSETQLKALDINDANLTSRSFKYLIQEAQKYGVTVDQLIAKLGKLGYAHQTLGSIGQGLDSTAFWDGLLTAEESANSGDKYKTFLSKIEEYQKAWEEGNVGTDEFDAFTALISKNGNTGVKTFEESMERINRYFTEDAMDGLNNFLNDLSQYSDETGKAFATINPATGEWALNLNNVKKAASDLGIGLEPFMMLLGKIEDMGGNIDVFSTTSEGITHLGELYTQLGQKQAELKRIQQEDPTNTSAIEDIQSDIDALNQSIEITKEGIRYLTQDAANNYKAEFEQGKTAIEALAEERKKILSNPDEYGDAADFALQQIESVMSEFADKYGITLTPDFEIDESSFAVLQEKAEKANITFNGEFDLSDSNVDGQLDLVKQKLDSLRNEDGTLPLDSSEVQDCLSILNYLIAKKIEAEQPAVMSMDTSNLDAVMSDYVSKLQEFQSAWNELQNLQLQKEAGIEIEQSSIDEAQSKVDALYNSLSTGETAKITADLELNNSSPEELAKSIGDVELVGKITELSDVESSDYTIDVIINGQEDIDSLKTELEGLPESTNVVVNASISEGADVTIGNIKVALSGIEDKNVTIVVDGELAQTTTEELQAALNTIDATNPDSILKAIDNASSTISSVQTQLTNLDGSSATVTIVTNRITNSSDGDGTHAMGTMFAPAHATGTTGYNVVNTISGSAYVNGQVSLPYDERALVNELGRESFIRDGKWMLLPPGMHLQDFKKGDIILSASQTEALIKYGRASGKGNAYANGTIPPSVLTHAYAGGGTFKPQGGASSYNPSGGGSYSSNNNYNNSNSNSNSNSTPVSNEEAKDTADTLDWIETLLKRIQDAIESLGKKASSVFKTWKNRNSALVEQMKKVNEELALQEQAYNRYLAETEPIGLSDHYKELVRNGAIDIELVSDETLKENIQNFQTWYEKALECEKALEDLKETAAELNKTKFDNVVSEFEQLLNKFNYQKNMMDEYMNQMAAHGYQTSTRYYQAKLIAESNSIKELEKQRNAMLVEFESAMLSGTIEKGSEAWYDMANQIDEVTIAIEEGHTAMLEYKKEIRDIEWGYFDLLQERITQITNEAEFLIDLMGNKKLYDDKGQLTDEGMATMGLYGQNYNVYMEQSKRYAEEIKRIDKELADDPYNQDLINRRNELLEQQREMILSAEQQKDAIVNLVKEGIELELESLKKLIDETNEALNSQKDLYDYQNRVRNQTQSLLELQKALSAYQGDDSEEAKVIKQQLQVNIEKAQQELQETEYDKYISDVTKLTSSLYDEYELILNSRLDNIDALVADMITEINSNASSINSTLEEQASSVGITLSSEMQDIWGGTDGIKTVLTFYGADIANSIVDAGTTINSTLGTINTNLSNMIEQLNKIAGTNIKAAATSEAEVSKEANAQKPQPKPEPTPEPEPESKADFFIYRKSEYPKDQLNKDTSIVDRLAYHDYDWSFDARKLYYNKMGFSGEYVSSAEQNIGMLNWMKLNGYKKGLKHADKDEWAWTQEDGKPEVIIRPSDGSILTPVKYDDVILNSIATENIFEFANNPGKFIDNLGKSWGNSTPNILNSVANNNNSLQNVVNGDIKIVLPNVKSYEDFKHDMQHDPNFEKMIQAMTVGRLLGGSRLDKYKYK